MAHCGRRRSRPRSGAATCRSLVLQRVQERAERVPRSGGEPCEALAGPPPLAIVSEDRRVEARRAAVVQELRPGADAPEWGGAHLAARGRALNDPVAEAAHIMEQEIRERLEHLA